jgi:predicted 3-demethylubiquinone-9 3-methyltransferase (glyoxalase superfamily)
MSQVTPFLWFNDQAVEAAKFYVSIFKKGKMVDFVPDGKRQQGVTFQIDGREFIAFNGGPTFKLTPAFSMFVSVKTQQEVDYYWEKLGQGGKPIQCGWLTDKFGVCWQIVPDILMKYMRDKDKKKAARVRAAMMKMVKLDIQKLKDAYKDEER